MRTFILTGTLACACAAAAAAQAPATGQQQDRQQGTTTITGCLYEEKDVPGRTPNVAERAGLGEDFIIATGDGAQGAAGTMYKVEDIDDDRLRAFVGKRVELTGKIDDDDDDAGQQPAGTSGTADNSVGPDRIELPEFEATSVRQVAGGSCPATPSAGTPPSAGMQDGAHTQPTEAPTQTATATEAETHTPPPVTAPPVTGAPSYPAPQPQAQQTPSQAQQPPVTEAPAYPRTSPAQAASVTLTGCLYRERDVPGRTPNIAERAGILEDYILADASVRGSASSAGTEGATGTSGTHPAIGKMFKVEHVADEKLAQFVGKRVEVTGTIDTEAGEMRQAGTAGAAGAAGDRSVGPDRIELPEFEATSIREVAGTCPATPQ